MHVLIAVASKHEATRGIADAIASGLIARGLEATVEPGDALDRVDEHYDAVVLGSAVYAGRWMRSARAFAKSCEHQLREQPVWLFSSGPVGEERPLPDGVAPVDLSKISTATRAIGHRVFAGRLDPAELGFLERSMVRAVHADTGDFRDWPAIDAFAEEIATRLTADAPAGQVTVPTNDPIA